MTLKRCRIVCVGEAMVELRPRDSGWDLGYGGDTLNAAIHLVRLGYDVGYLTALGNESFGRNMRVDWGREGMDTSLVLTHPDRRTGLYAIEIDKRGERQFQYWRGESAARSLFECDGADAAQESASEADMLFFSLISLAILPDNGRRRLLGLAQQVLDRGGQVAFDSNYRPGLWEDAATARTWCDRAINSCTIGLPTLEDDMALADTRDERQVALRWQALGCPEVVVKMGERGCRLPDGALVAPPVTLAAVDTSGAGDAFDAGYLGARLRGIAPAQAAALAQSLAGWTVMNLGALPLRNAAAPYGAIVSALPE